MVVIANRMPSMQRLRIVGTLLKAIISTSVETVVVAIEFMRGVWVLDWRSMGGEERVAPRSCGTTSPRGCRAKVPFMYKALFGEGALSAKCLKKSEKTVLETLPKMSGSKSAETLLWTKASEVYDMKSALSPGR